MLRATPCRLDEQSVQVATESSLQPKVPFLKEKFRVEWFIRVLTRELENWISDSRSHVLGGHGGPSGMGSIPRANWD